MPLLAMLVGATACFVLLVRFMRRPKEGLYLAIFASAILLSPDLPVVREKFTAAEFVMILTWAALLLGRGRKRARTLALTRDQHLSMSLGGAFIAWAVVSFAVNQATIAWNGSLVAGAVETLNFAYGYLMFCTVVYLVDDWQDLRGCLLAWFAGVAVVAFFGVWALIGGAPGWTYDDFTGRISSTLRTENQVPMFLIPVMVALVFWAVRRGLRPRERLTALAVLGGLLLTMAGTGSRIGFGMVILAVLATIWLALIEARRSGFRKGLLFNLSMGLVAAVSVYVFIALVGYQGGYALGETPAWQRPVVMLHDWVEGTRALDSTRPAQLRQAWIIFLDQPLLGTGPKLYSVEYRMAEVHNTYAGVMLQTGILGLLLLLVWQFHLLWVGWRTGRSLQNPFHRLMVLSLLVGLALVMVYGLTMFGLRQRSLWLVAGLIVAAQSLYRRELVAQRLRRNTVSAPTETRPYGGTLQNK